MRAAATTQSLRAAGGPRGRTQPSPLFLGPAADVIEETTVAAERPDGVSQSCRDIIGRHAGFSYSFSG